MSVTRSRWPDRVVCYPLDSNVLIDPGRLLGIRPRSAPADRPSFSAAGSDPAPRMRMVGGVAGSELIVVDQLAVGAVPQAAEDPRVDRFLDEPGRAVAEEE